MSKIDVREANQHQKYMARAFMLAEQALEEDEVPIGAIIVRNGQIVGKGYNQVQRLNDPTAHAEMIAISAACDNIGEKYLSECTMYVTLEPCSMCAGALVWSKLGRLVFGALDPRAGACGSLFNLTENQSLNHRVEVIHGVMEKDCEYLLKHFFEKKRRD